MDHTILDQLIDVPRLPASPSTVRALVDLASREDAGSLAFVDVLGEDPGTVLWMVRQANSGLFGPAGRVGSVEEAVTNIGARAAKIIGLSMVPAIGGLVAGGVRGAVGELWARAQLRDRAVREIARRMGEGAHLGPARTAAYGIEAAWFALAVVDPELLARSVGRGEEAWSGRGVFGESAASCSAGLLDCWGLPVAVTEAVRDSGAIESVEATCAVARMVRGAEIVTRHILGRGVWGDQARAEHALKAMTGIEAGSFREIISATGAHHERDIREWMGADEPGVRSRAVELLAKLSLAMQIEHHEVMHQRDELLHRATVDRLTGLLNRGAFDDRIAEELERARRTQEPLALLMCDLDDFKALNDRYGHLAGDHVLTAVGEELQDAARRVDVVARYGGEEFAVIAPCCDYPGAAYLGERLRAAIGRIELEWDDCKLRTTMSIGGAVCNWPGAVLSPAQLISAADRRLYEAKRNGRNCVRIEPPDKVRAWAS